MARRISRFPYFSNPRPVSHLTGFLASLVEALRRVAGVGAAMLPRRWWDALDLHVPASDSALISGILTFMAGAGLGIVSFISHATNWAAETNRLVLDSPDLALSGAGSVSMLLAFFTFLFFTPWGWLTMYLSLSGFIRAGAAAFSESFGDPLLTALDAVALGTIRHARANRVRARREALEGPEVADRIVPGSQIGMPGVDFVIVASRVKPDWDKGTVVISVTKTYRVGPIEERTIAGRLRTLYPLTEHKDLEVFRRTVRYDLPE
jgi:hypothetical protein